MAKYDKPSWFTTKVGNPAMALLVKLGISPAGAHLLAQVLQTFIRHGTTHPVRSLPKHHPLTHKTSACEVG